MFPRSNTITLDAALRDVKAAKDPRTRADAAHALAEPGAEATNRERARATLIAALRDPHPDVRASAALSLAQVGGDGAARALGEGLGDDVMLARQSCAIALGRLGDAAGFEPLARALREGPPDLRFQAATSMVEIDPARAQAPLCEAFATEEDPEVLGAIALGLGEIADRDAIEVLARHLDHPADRTRFDVAYAVASLGDSRAIDVLREFVIRGDFAWPAIEALERTGDRAAVDAIEPALSQRTHRLTRVRAAAGLLALDPGHELARATLLAGLSAWRVQLRALAVDSLRRVGGRWAVEPLRALATRRAGRAIRDEIDQALRACESRAAG